MTRLKYITSLVLIVALVFLVVSVKKADAAMSILQEDDAIGALGDPITLEFTSVTAGDRIVVCIATAGPGNIFTQPEGFVSDLEIATTTDSASIQVYSKVAVGGETDLTFTQSGAVTSRAYGYVISPANTLDVSVKNGPAVTTTVINSGTTTATTVADTIAIGCLGTYTANIAGGGQAMDNSFTMDFASGFIIVGHRIHSSIQSGVDVNFSWTGNESVYAGIVVYGETPAEDEESAATVYMRSDATVYIRSDATVYIQ